MANDRSNRMIRTFSSRPPADNPLWPGDFDIHYPDPAKIHLADIAHGLAGKFRFAAQSPIRKTVARHSIEVADRCSSPGAKEWGLFHDAAEAYLGDIPRPHKRLMTIGGTFIRDIEEGILDVIAERFGLPWPVSADIAAEIQAADDACLEEDQVTLWLGPSFHPSGQGQMDLDKLLWLRAARAVVKEGIGD